MSRHIPASTAGEELSVRVFLFFFLTDSALSGNNELRRSDLEATPHLSRESRVDTCDTPAQNRFALCVL